MSEPDFASLARALQDLSRRVERLESLVQSRPLRADTPHLVAKPAFSENLEERVGSQYLNRAGVIALLVGIAFFLHWAFTNNWIGAIAVVTLGFIGGIALFVFGEWFVCRGYSVFGLSLEGLGIAALYLTLWAAFQFYQLLAGGIAFAAMVVLTVTTAVIAIGRNSETLAIFAAIGGFGTPLLLSAGHNLELELFTYLLVLCAGTLATLRFRPWTGLLLTSFLGALAVSVVWFATYYRASEQVPTLIFFSLMLAAFIAAPILAQRAFAAGTNLILLFVPGAAALVFLLGTGSILDEVMFTATAQTMAIAFLITSWRWCRGGLRVVYFVIAIAGSASSIPVSVDGHWPTSAIWLTYGLVLMLYGLARKVAFIRWTALALIAVTVLKVFIFDLSNLGQGYRILALSVLGVALLSLSFLYQRDWRGLRKQ